jgi:hypothetical protein
VTLSVVISRWGENGIRPTPLATNASLFGRMVVRASLAAACSLDDAWRLVTDVRSIGRFSPECISAEWVLPDRGPRLGARFEGTNRKVTAGEELVWVRPCTVVVAEPGRAFGYVVGDRYDGSAAGRWDYELTASRPGECRILLTFRHHRDGLSALRLRADADPAHAAELVAARTSELDAGMRTTLARMKAALEAHSADAPTQRAAGLP